MAKKPTIAKAKVVNKTKRTAGRKKRENKKDVIVDTAVAKEGAVAKKPPKTKKIAAKSAPPSVEMKKEAPAAIPRRSVIAVKKVEKEKAEIAPAAEPVTAAKPGVKQKISLEHPDENHVDNIDVNLAGKQNQERVRKEIERFSSDKDVPSAPFSGAVPLSDVYHEEEDVLSKKGKRVREVVTTEVKQEREKKDGGFIETQVRARRSVKLYRKIALIFVFLTVVLLAAIFYFSFTKVTITLIPNQERISNNMIIDIYDGEKIEQSDKNAIKGVVKLVEISHKKTYESSGTEVVGEETAGKVKIYNSYTKNQPLVATTRLLAPDGKLFRIKNTVNVPVGGSVEVEVYADQPGPEMAIGPTKFTIPGLWAGLQDKIYAENSEPIIYKQKVKKHVVQEDIDNSIRDLKKELLDKAKSEINENYKDYSQIIYDIDENTIKSKVYAKDGDPAEEFEAEMEADVAVVAFEDQLASELAKQKFISSLPENKELVSFDANNIIYSLSNYNYNEGVAAVNANFDGKVTLKENYEIVEKNKILGLNEGQLDAYLSGLPEIAGFEVKFFPAFIKKVPRLADRVDIIVKK
jgi:hypothetical protein